MTRLDALIDLRDKVKAGWPPDIDTPYMRPFIAVFGSGWIAARANDANRGSLDAAKALHEAVLPGREYIIKNYRSPRTAVRVGFKSVSDEIPARAWLIAILEALIAQERDA